jgi:FkbM family methyltransferase
VTDPRFPSRSPHTQRLLEHMPVWGLRMIAARRANLRPLELYPGWRFNSADGDADPDGSFRRELWRVFQAGGARDAITVRWYDGLRLHLYLGNDLSHCLFVGGTFEPNEFVLLERVLEPGMVFVDGGANDGLYSLFAATRVGETGKVIAFEPSAREFRRLRANIALNRLDEIVARNTALGAEPGNTHMAIAEAGHEGQNTIGSRISNPTVRVSGQETVVVERLDSVVEELGLERVDLIKLDVEGSELRALIGAGATIERFRPLLVVEVESERLDSQGATREDVLDLIATFGYSTYVFDSETAQLRAPDLPTEPEGNVIAAPADWLPPSL